MLGCASCGWTTKPRRPLQLASSLTDAVLRYRQIELGREALQRWDGRIVIGDSALARAAAAGSTDAAEQPTTDVEPVEEAGHFGIASS